MINTFPEFTYWRTEEDTVTQLNFMAEVRKLHEGKYYKIHLSKQIKITITSEDYHKSGEDILLKASQEFLLDCYRAQLFGKITHPDPEYQSKIRQGFSVTWRLDENQETEENRTQRLYDERNKI